MLPITIASITGTVEDNRRARSTATSGPITQPRALERPWLAQARGTALPPVSVYRVDHAHFLRDGHHRASVARDQGFATIDAEVVELRPPRHG